MAFTLSGQTWIFLFSCLLGVGLSLVYDLFRLLRITVKTGKVATAAEDVLFFLIVSLSVFLFLLRFTEGMIRFYVLVGAAAGFLLCHLTASAWIVRLLGGVIRAVKRACACVHRVVFCPIFRKISAVMRRVCKHFVNKSSNHLFKRKKDLSNSNKIMYNCTIRSKKTGKRKQADRCRKKSGKVVKKIS